MKKSMENILSAAIKTHVPVFLWGSSGFGKTSFVKEYAQKNGLDVEELRVSNLDVLDLSIPTVDTSKKVMGRVLDQQLNRLVTTEKPTICFLDEFTRPLTKQTYSIFMQLLNERQYREHKISEHVHFVAASNLESEDDGVVELPDALMKRAMHLEFSPSVTDVIEVVKDEKLKKMLLRAPTFYKQPGKFSNQLVGCPRQCEKLMEIINLKTLSNAEIRLAAEGLLGAEHGPAFLSVLKSIQEENPFPKNIKTKKNREMLEKLEAKGQVAEVVGYLKSYSGNKKDIATYLLLSATPETCRAMSSADFNYMYFNDVEPVSGNKFIGSVWDKLRELNKCA